MSEEIIEYDSEGNVIHSKNSDESEEWIEYDSEGNLIKRTTIEVFNN